MNPTTAAKRKIRALQRRGPREPGADCTLATPAGPVWLSALFGGGVNGWRPKHRH